MPIGRVYTNRFDRYKGRIVRQHGGGPYKGYEVPTKYSQRGKGLGAVVLPIAKQAAFAAGGALLSAGKKYIRKKFGKKKGKGKRKGSGRKGSSRKGKSSSKGWGAQLVTLAKDKAKKAISSYLGGGGGGGGGGAAAPSTAGGKKRKTRVGGSRAAKVENRLSQIRKNNAKTLNRRKKQRGGGNWGGPKANPFEVKRPPPYFGRWPDP